VIATDRDGRVTFLNPVAQSLTGWKREEAAGMPLRDILNIVSEQTGKVADNPVTKVIREGAIVGLGNDTVLIAKDGTRRPIEDSAAPIRDSQGDIIGVVLVFHDVSERRRADEALRERTHDLGERVKELNCLYGITQLVEKPDVPLEYIVQGTADLIPQSWQYPEVTCARISLDGQEFRTDNFREGPWSQIAGILVRGERAGAVEVCYLEERPESDEGPFLKEERSLINAIAQHVGETIERRQAEEALRSLNEELEADRKAIEELNRSLEEKVRQRTDDLRLANEELRERNRQLLDARAQAATDGLTDLANHRAFHERIQADVQRARETGSSVGLIMLDIDGFKRFNDSLGHLAGDEILRGLADTLAGVVGHEDAHRYGGDEFAVLMPGADCRETGRVAERLRRAVAKRRDGSGPGVTVSLGVACFPNSAESAEELIYGADAAMYWAKSAGKDRVGDWGKLIKHREEGTLPWYAADRGVKAPDVVAALVAALAAKDPTTAGHTERCSWYSGKLAQELGLSEEDSSIVRLAALLHDIGKLAVPDEVLRKPGPLTDEEWVQMKQHPVAALHVLAQVRSIADATPAILHHHEHFNGSGYPDGLAGDDIPVASRILLVTDAFDAMTTDRPYRKAMPVEAAIDELKRHSGSQFDPVVVDSFLRMLSRQGAQPLRHKADNHEGPTERKRPARKSRTRATIGQRRRAETASPSGGRRK
jgi:diguanylate cyclase (GGDEF)-like protein/PAS domain S-box-containing protein